MTIETPSSARLADALSDLRAARPLVHCLTNEVVQEITANVLLAAGASPAMVVAEEESGTFARIAGGILVNMGTPFPERLRAMRKAVEGAREAGRPWVLDPVAAGGIPWRDGVIREFVELKPTVIRGNASEILALAGAGTGGKGVDSTADSSDALEAARALADRTGGVVAVTGAVDYVTDGTRTFAISGGDPMATLVVGTGCSLSALVAAFCAAHPNALEAAAAACALAKRAAEVARRKADAPGSFHVAYIDALYTIRPEELSAGA